MKQVDSEFDSDLCQGLVSASSSSDFPADVLTLWETDDERMLQTLMREARGATHDQSTRQQKRGTLQLAGVALSRIGAHRRAMPLLKRAVFAHPGDLGAWNDLGIAQLAEGQPLDALRTFERAQALNPDELWTVENLALVEMVLGRPDSAATMLGPFLVHSSSRPSILVVLGNALFVSGNFSEAEACLRTALASEPALADAQIVLGQIAERTGCHAVAEQHYRTAIETGSRIAKSRFFLGQFYKLTSQPHLALDQFLHGLAHAPAHRPTLQALAMLLAEWLEAPATPELLEILRDACRYGDIDAQELLHPSLRLIRREVSIIEILREIGLGTSSSAIGLTSAGSVGDVFLELLSSTPISDPRIEEELTALRQRLLDEIYVGRLPRVDLSLAAAMARQCFYNGFVYPCGSEEERRVRVIAERISATLVEATEPTGEHELALLILATYHPLNEIITEQILKRWPQATWSQLFREVLRIQVSNRREERGIAQSLERWPSFPAATNCGTVARVRTQYENYPYPPWSGLSWSYPKPVATVLKSLFPHFAAPQFLTQPCRVLVAGCGTGKHALTTSRRFITSEIVGVDISLTSLAYGVRMARELGLNGVTFIHGDLNCPPANEKQFDVIECAGVLHHLADPEAGWRQLSGLLRPGGVMKIALYSARAREGICAARQFLEQHEYCATLNGVRQGRQALFALETGNLARGVMALGDFYSTNGCIDLLFHVQEQTFDIARLARCLEDLKLRLIGFEAISPEVKAAFHALFPTDPEGTNLTFWHAFEQLYPLTFLRMYQLWCQKQE